jgi:hypothetical protein
MLTVNQALVISTEVQRSGEISVIVKIKDGYVVLSVTSTAAERSKQIENINWIRFLRVGRNDIAYVMLQIVGDMEL